MIQSLDHPDYWAFASAILLSLTIVHFRLRRKGKHRLVSGADWLLVVSGLAYGWLGIDCAVKWQDARIDELIQRLLVPMHAQLTEEGVRHKIVPGTPLGFSPIAYTHRDPGETSGSRDGAGALTGRNGMLPPEKDDEGLVKESNQAGALLHNFVSMPDSAAQSRAVLDVDYINRKKAMALTAMQSMATAVVAALFLAITGIVVYFRVRDEALKSEIEAARALAESEQRFRLLFKASPDAILVTDPDGIIRDVNPRACEMLELDLEQLTGMHIVDLVDRDHRQSAMEDFRELAAGNIDYIEDTCFSSSDGRQIPVEVRSRRILYPEKPACLLHVHDLTERIVMEQELRHAQKMEGIGQLAAGVAHDFNNLLTVIQGHTILLLEEHAGQDGVIRSLNEVASAADRAAELTRHLLTFSRKQQMRLEFLDPNDVLNSILRMLGRVIPEHIDVELKMGENMPSIRADRGMIEQVITNFLMNARDAMPGGGSLTLSTKTTDVGSEEAFEKPFMKSGNHVVIEIEDTGKGMDKEMLERVFEPFFTTKDVGTGTGLGLASAYGIVTQHGGWIHADSAPGKGTTFSIYLPAREEPSTPAAIAPAAEVEVDVEVEGGTETILIVEDEPALRELVALNLERFGYQVIKASSGREALVIWENVREEVDLLLTDLVMPEGVSGRELGELIGSENRDLPIVYMSGYSGEVTGTGDDYDLERQILRKPYTPNALARTIRSTLDRI